MSAAMKIQLMLAGLVAAACAARGATTFYVDSRGGDNASAGTAPEAAWKDFSNINGRTLAADERLLIRRGSVINQELRVNAQGTRENWAEIGAYGTGARPIIRRNWDIADRCALIRDPDFLRIRSLTVCFAGKGLIVYFATPGHGNLLIEDCIAHHIEGFYRPNSSGIPEWRDFKAPGDDGLGDHGGAGIGVTGNAHDVTLRDCDTFQCSWGFRAACERITVDRVYCHHNFAFNTSPHPALTSIKDSTLQNSIFDAAGYHAFAGTMGIMLVDPRQFTIRNCTFRNQPDSGSHDEGGIDFEARGDGCLIENCTFQNNAGAAIEVLGLRSPQPKNVEIRNSRFIQNNWAKKLGPSEIFIWGGKDPKVCCSTGTIHNNGCVLLPGVEFFTNEAPTLTQWQLTNNSTFPTRKALDKALPLNNPPVVSAGADIISDRAEVKLRGSVSDDGRPADKKLITRWELLEGPGEVAFKQPDAAATTATFTAPGDYLLRLVGDDGELWTSSLVTIHIVPRGVSVAKAWEFNTPLDKEGWTEAGLGTQICTNRINATPPPGHSTGVRGQTRPLPQIINCISYPVSYVAGGYYIVAIENAPAARLLSADNLGVNIKRHKTLRLRLQNHTTAERMKLSFVTRADGAWDDAKSCSFAVTPNDAGLRDYAVDLSAVPGWTGKLRQLRLNLTGGTPATGTCRIDYIWIDDSKPVTPP